MSSSRILHTLRRALAGVLACAPALLVAQAAPHPWQTLNLPTADQVRAGWLTPPPEYGPEPYFGLNGPVTLDTVRHDLDTMQALGFRAVTVQYGFGSNRPYLSPAYLDFFREMVLAARQRNMRIWIVDDAGYPSGFAGGKFSAEHPELRMQALVALSKTSLEQGAVFDQAVPPETVSVTAIRSSNGETLAIPFESGTAHWTAPEGQWTVYVVAHQFRTSPTRSDTNPKRVKDGTQSLEDYLDPAATAQFLQFTHDAYKTAVGDEFGKTILGFRGDEPDYSIAGLPWTPKFFGAFAQIKGYDVRPWLAAFLQPKEVALTTEQLRVKADYYDVFSRLFRDGFFKPQADWCAVNGLEYQVHLNHEEQQLALARSEGDFFRDMRFVQVPGIDTIWHQIWTDTISDFPRLASSAAHVYGHPRAFTESFAAYRPLPDVTMARYILNEQFVRGVNLVEAMYFPASSTPGHGGPMAFMRDPAFPALMRYTSRVSYLLSQGRPAADVALLLPSESLWMGDARADDTFVSTERLLSEHQVDFDVVDEDALGSLLQAERGAFVSMSGNRYRTVLVPAAGVLPETVVERLRTFAAGGGHVVFMDRTPSRVAGRTDRDARAVQPADFAWATTLPANLPPTPVPPAQPPTSPPAPIVVSPLLVSTLIHLLPAQAITVAAPEASLRVLHRTLKDATVYFLFNESATPLQDQVTLRAPGRRVEIWDAETGSVHPADVINGQDHGQHTLSLTLAPYATQILVVR